LLVASLEPRKNIERLVNAWKRISTKLRDKTLVIAGGKYRVFKEIDTSQTVENVRWLGYVVERDLPGLYSAAQAYILPSLYEGFGLSALEAMACGTPVVVASSGALPEVVGESALFFDPHSVDSIAQAIETILCDPILREEHMETGLERSRLFSWDRTAQEVWLVLERAAA
jgi:glycosyltransferase involved in cell wall biosynthesis